MRSIARSASGSSSTSKMVPDLPDAGIRSIVKVRTVAQLGLPGTPPGELGQKCAARTDGCCRVRCVTVDRWLSATLAMFLLLEACGAPPAPSPPLQERPAPALSKRRVDVL